MNNPVALCLGVQQKRSEEEMDKRVTQVSGRVEALHEHVNQVEYAIEVRHRQIRSLHA